MSSFSVCLRAAALPIISFDTSGELLISLPAILDNTVGEELSRMTRRRINPVPGICRIDQPAKRNHGFFVRMQRKGRVYSAFFADRSHGGRRWALVAAKWYLRWLKRKLGPMDRKRWAQIKRRPSASGIQGVLKTMVWREGAPYTFWQATWSPEPYVVKRKVFSVRKYGARKARQLAIRARRAGVRNMK